MNRGLPLLVLSMCAVEVLTMRLCGCSWSAVLAIVVLTAVGVWAAVWMSRPVTHHAECHCRRCATLPSLSQALLSALVSFLAPASSILRAGAFVPRWLTKVTGPQRLATALPTGSCTLKPTSHTQREVV